jgi:hypothetical protein
MPDPKKPDPADRFVWRPGDLVIVKKGDGSPVEPPAKKRDRSKPRPKSIEVPK